MCLRGGATGRGAGSTGFAVAISSGAVVGSPVLVQAVMKTAPQQSGG